MLMKRRGAKCCSLFFPSSDIFKTERQRKFYANRQRRQKGGGGGNSEGGYETAGWESILRTRKKSIQGVSGDGKG